MQVRKFKIAYLIGSLNRGGAETLLLDIFRHSKNAPFEMSLIHRNGGTYLNEFDLLGQIYQVSPRGMHIISYWLRLRRIIKSEGITIIHAHYWLDVIYAWMATIGLHLPIVYTFHGYMGAEANWKIGLRYKMAIGMADRLCFVSAFEKERYEKRYGKAVGRKGCVIYNGVDFEKIDKGCTLTKILPEQEKGNLKLCMVGSFNSVRNQMEIAQALRLLRQEGITNYDFYFVGSRYKGEEHWLDECVGFCQDNNMSNVHFLGNRDDVPAILHQMNGYVYCSKNDTFGIAVVEALSIGLPIVVNDHPVMQEICDCAGKNVLFYQSGDIEDCAQKIRMLIQKIQNEKNLKDVCVQSSAKIRENYNIDRHIKRLYEIYNGL